MTDVSWSKLDILKQLRFGERIAEEEVNELERYFVETDQWHMVYSGDVDVIYGPKGAGKSAIYALINRQENKLFDRGIIVKNAENVRGATVFKDIVTDPPPNERSFLALWKLYFLVICASAIREYDIRGRHSKELIASLERSGLLPVNATIATLFTNARKQIWSYLFPDRESVEWTIAIEPASGLPIATRKTTFRPSNALSQEDVDIPLDLLVGIANNAFHENNVSLWILFDRLDVAFNDTPEIERNALRALFRMYNDFRGYRNIGLKIFVRDDIWDRISEGGFSEASHITRTTNINWNYENLLNLFVRRLLVNEEIITYLRVVPDRVVDDFGEQMALVNRIFPDQVETGKNPETFKWIVNRIQDGSGKPAPRELIHFAECIRREQAHRLERGESAPEGEMLFDRSVFKVALREVSRVRYEQTFLAENPSLKEYTDRLKGKKAEHNLETLSDVWRIPKEEARLIAERLTKAGFFENREGDGEQSYWVPFIYRDALELSQGKAFG